MDDTFLKTLFWTMVALYTIAVIGAWENFIKPLWHFAVVFLAPLFLSIWQYIMGLAK